VIQTKCERCGRWADNEFVCDWCCGTITPPGPEVQPAPLCPVCGEHPMPRDLDLFGRALVHTMCVVCRKRRELPPDAPRPERGRGRVVTHGPWTQLGWKSGLPWYWTEFRRPPAVPEPMHELVRAPSSVHGDAERCESCGCVCVRAKDIDDRGREIHLAFYGVDFDSLTLPREVPNCEPLHHPLSTREGWRIDPQRTEDSSHAEHDESHGAPYRPLASG